MLCMCCVKPNRSLKRRYKAIVYVIVVIIIGHSVVRVY